MNVFKKVLASLSICLFIVMLLGQSVRQDHAARDTAYAVGRLAGLVIALAGLFYSTRWLLLLSGRRHKVGRQAFATLWCCESVLGILLGLFLVRSATVTGLVITAAWSLSFWLTYRWLSKLRREDLIGLPAV
jgi:hypothetical protein